MPNQTRIYFVSSFSPNKYEQGTKLLWLALKPANTAWNVTGYHLGVFGLVKEQVNAKRRARILAKKLTKHLLTARYLIISMGLI